MSDDIGGTLPALAIDLRRGMPMHRLALHLCLIATAEGFPLSPNAPVCEDQTIHRFCRRIPDPCFAYTPTALDKGRSGLGCAIYSRSRDRLDHVDAATGLYLLHAGDFNYDQLLIKGLTHDSEAFLRAVAGWFMSHFGAKLVDTARPITTRQARAA